MADDIRDDILEKIRILEEDRDNVEFSTELWTDTELGNAQKSHPMHGGPISNSRRKGHGKKSKTQGQFDFGYVNGNGNKRKRKPVTVSDILLQSQQATCYVTKHALFTVIFTL